MIEALKSAGWEFACNGYDGTNYGSDEEAVSADLTKWNEKCGNTCGKHHDSVVSVRYRQPWMESI